MNWGTKLVLGMATFMVFIMVLGILMVTGKKDELVDNDYYEKGINYNREYQLKKQMNYDHASPAVVVNQDMILLTFRLKAKGTARLMRTADKKLDQSVPFESNINQQVMIPVATLRKGSWRLIIDWKSNARSYLYEQEITIR